MNKIVDVINSLENIRTIGPVSEEKIQQAQKELGLKFAPDYAAYLASFGVMSGNGHEMTGICSSERLDVVSVTLRQRKLNPDVPSEWYVIEELNVNDIVAWQDGTGSVYLTTPDKKLRKVSNCLLDYLRK